MVRGVLNKQPGIKAELVQGKPDWKTWDFTQLINALRKWKEIHPREIAKSRDRSYYVEDKDLNAPRGYVFCNNTSMAEQTRFGWTIMLSGAEVDSQNMFLTQTSIGDYEELCRMDVLGLQDTPIGDQDVVHQEFLEQLKRSPEGWYETALPWKGGHYAMMP